MSAEYNLDDVDQMSSAELYEKIMWYKQLQQNPVKVYTECTLKEKDLKQDSGKLRYDLFPVEALEEITKVLNFGASKYAPRSWEAGMAWGRLYAAVLRHMTAWFIGEEYDKESGISHLAHAGCSIVFLLTYARRNSGTDDRPCAQYKTQHYPQTGENK